MIGVVTIDATEELGRTLEYNTTLIRLDVEAISIENL
jgi:hypothetical protein